MEETICPECGAPVGGTNHRTVEGVREAADLERHLDPPLVPNLEWVMFGVAGE